MKIVSITQVKNESDIIESFIRYHLNIVDEMIILENGSSDETPIIINNLIKENLPIKLINDSDFYYTQDIKTTALLNKAVKEYGADLVLILDVDEFIINDNNENPRKILESINLKNYYLIKWTTYIPTPNDDYNIKFIPQRITHRRDENLEQFYKVIVPKDIVNQYDIKVAMGSHDLIIEGADKSKLIKKDLNLKIAHFPLRSKEQCISKISIGWPNIIAINIENQPWSFHWKILFDNLKKNNDITLDDLEDFAKNYALTNHLNDIEIKNQPISLDFCKNIEIKWDYDYNYLRNILENYVYFAEEIVSYKRKIKETPCLDDTFLDNLINDFNTIEKSNLFDVEWYNYNYNPNPNIDPIIHYLLTWRTTMNDPSSFFSTEFYYKTHKDVAKAGMNPFVHYIKYGKNENRKIAPSPL